MFEIEVGKAIAKLRGSRTRREVARKAGIKPAAWSVHERARRQIRPRTLGKILKGLGCTLEQLELEVFRQLADRFAAKLLGQTALLAEPAPQHGAATDSSTRPIHEHAQAAAHHYAAYSILLQESLAAQIARALRSDSSE